MDVCDDVHVSPRHGESIRSGGRDVFESSQTPVVESFEV
jgi:hypothetical protein